MQIEGKAAVVTGSATGVGRATALQLARGGCSVLVNYSRSRDEAEQTAADIEKLGVRTLCLQADVSDDGQCRKMIDEAARAFGRLDILVNNAGTTRFIDLADLDEVHDADWERILAVNLKGIAEVIEDKKNGYLFSPDAPNEFKTKLAVLSTNPLLSENQGAAAFEKSKTICNISTCSRLAADCFLRILLNPYRDDT